MWVVLAFLSAVFVGFCEVFKKQALVGNAVLPVLWLNILFSVLLLLPVIICAETGAGWFDGTVLQMPRGSVWMHGLVLVKACIVLSSWLCMYFALKYLPITLAAPVNATYPVLTLLGAMVLFGERLNVWQWSGIVISVFSLVLLNRSGQKEGVSFAHNKWIWLLGAGALCSAASGLYDKFLMRQVHFLFVQAWYGVYQLLFMSAVVAVLYRLEPAARTRFCWKWSVLWVSVFFCISEFIYFYALQLPGSMISVVSMIRRSSVVVTFVCGAFWFREKNLKSKALDLCFVIIGMLFLWIGSY